MIFDHILNLESIRNGSKYKNKAKIVQKIWFNDGFGWFSSFFEIGINGK
jgi:hypothetical protein